jgi:hypothetical protein
LILLHALGFGEIQRSRDVDAIIKGLLELIGIHKVPPFLCVRGALMLHISIMKPPSA